MAGGISGGCLERDVLSKAWWRTREGPVVVTYDSTSADDDETWTFGLGCNGRVEVLLERLPPSGEAHPLDFIARCLATRQPGVMATVFRGGPGAGTGRRLLLDREGVRSTVPPGPVQDRLAEEAAAASRGGKSRTARLELEDGPLEVLLEVIRPAAFAGGLRHRPGRGPAGEARRRTRLPRHGGVKHLRWGSGGGCSGMPTSSSRPVRRPSPKSSCSRLIRRRSS